MTNELKPFGTVTSAWNTRPAAPVEGLKVVGIQHLRSVDGQWHHGEAEYANQDERELVTRSQAEELLAAERAEHDNTIATLTSLITDNAALTARVKAINTPIEAVDFLYKHGDLTYGAAKQAIDLLVSNGFYVGKRAALEVKP